MENINKLTLVTPPRRTKVHIKYLGRRLAGKKLSVSHLPKLQLMRVTVTSSDREYWRTKWL